MSLKPPSKWYSIWCYVRQKPLSRLYRVHKHEITKTASGSIYIQTCEDDAPMYCRRGSPDDNMCERHIFPRNCVVRWSACSNRRDRPQAGCPRWKAKASVSRVDEAGEEKWVRSDSVLSQLTQLTTLSAKAIVDMQSDFTITPLRT